MTLRIFTILFCLCLSFLVDAVDTSAAVRAEAPATIFTVDEPLKFTTTLTRDSLRWVVKNWKGEILRSGEWPDGGKRPLILEKLPTGYYTLELQGKKNEFSGVRSFTVLPNPATRVRNSNTYFAIDSAQSWLARANPANSRHPGDGYKLVSEALRRSGVEVVRDRLSWNDTEYAPEKYNWGRYAQNAALLAERGIAVSGMYHDAAKHAKGGDAKRILPSDLLATYRYAKAAAEHFQGKMSSWEFWNEEDLYFSQEGAWDYAAAMKAAYLGFKAGAPDCSVLLGGLAITPLTRYTQIVMDNGVGDYIDVFNIHSYHPLHKFPTVIRNAQEFMTKNNIASRPLWITENGSNVEGQGRVDSFMKGIRAHDPEQELLVAEFLSKMLIIMQSLGVDRDFFFVFSPYNEIGGGKDWGLLRRDYSAKPGVAAFSTLSELFNTAKYCGSFDFGNPAVRGFLYELPDGTQSLAFWSKSRLDIWPNDSNARIEDLYAQEVKLSLPDGSYNGRDLVGVPFSVQSVRGTMKLNVNRFPSYLTGLKGLKASQPFAAIKKEGAPTNVDYDRTVILRVNPSADFSHNNGKDWLFLLNDSGKMEIEVYNLSDQPKQGKVFLSGGGFKGVPKEIKLSPFSKKSFVVEYSLDLPPGKYQTEIRGSGTFNGKSISPLSIPLYASNKLIFEARKVSLKGTEDPANWKKNSSGSTEISYDAVEKAIKFTTKFPPRVDRWVYPEYTLQLPQESLRGAIGISFEVKCSTDKVIRSLLMGVIKSSNGKTKDFYFPYKKAGSDWSEKVTVFANNKLDGDQIDPAKIIRIRIGMNPQVDDMTYFVRNIRVLYAK